MPVSHCPYGFYGQVTVEAVGWPGAWPCLPYWPYGFFASEQKFRTVRLTVETVGGDRIWPLVRLLRSVAAVSTVSTVSCYGLYGLHGQLLRLIKAGLDRGGFISSSTFEGSSSLRCQQRRNSRGFGVTVRIDRAGLTVKTVGSVWYTLNVTSALEDLLPVTVSQIQHDLILSTQTKVP